MFKIFISYRRDDSADSAGRIYDYLTQPLGPFPIANIFKDVDSIPFGVHFKKYLENEVQQCAACLVIIGPRWADITDENGRRLDDPTDFVRIEIEAALQRGIPVIPLLVGGAPVPDASKLPPSLAELPYMNGARIRRDPDFKPDMARLIRALEKIEKGLLPQDTQSAAPAFAQAPTEPLPHVEVAKPAPMSPPKTDFTLPMLEWIGIPAGKVTLEGRSETFDVEPFYIAKYPVTNAQFEAFIQGYGYYEDRYWHDLAKREMRAQRPSWNEPTHPRETVNWYEAMAFTRWLSEKTGLSVILPTEMQWQWAAVGDKGWAYPYGNVFDKTKCNTTEGSIYRTTPVDHFPQGASPFGVMDMSGNVWEWTITEIDKPLSHHIDNSKRRMVRGGSWDLNMDVARATYRYDWIPFSRFDYLGFRVCCMV